MSSILLSVNVSSANSLLTLACDSLSRRAKSSYVMLRDFSVTFRARIRVLVWALAVMVAVER